MKISLIDQSMDEEDHVIVNMDQSETDEFFKANSNIICADILHTLPREFIGTIKFKDLEYNFWRVQIKVVDGDFFVEIYVEDFSLQGYKNESKQEI